MKKIIRAVAAAVCAVFLSGCSGSMPFTKPKPDFSRPFSAKADITCGKLKAQADVSREDDRWSFSFTAPESLCGIVMKLDENGMNAQLGSLYFTASDNDGYALCAEIIAKSASTLPSLPAESVTSKDGVLTLETDFDGSKVFFTADEKTGDLLTLKCPKQRLSVQFSS